ncbi:MAG TPA: hypothetical protein EYO59_13085 [Chromatiaceae bacterium]|nr:hypothetical protein [Chromatiaceae bacterium]
MLLEEDAYNSNTESFVVLKDEIRRARSYLAASVEKQTDMLDALDHLATLAIAVEAVLQSNIDRGRTTPGEIAKTNYEKWLTAIADPDSGDLKKRCDDILEDLHVLGENPEIQLIVFQLRVAQALDPQAIQERAAANGILPTIRDRRCWEHYSNEYRHLDAAVILDFGKRRR